MTTIYQHILKKTKRFAKFHKNRTKILQGGPQRKGVVQKMSTESPKKPNSAKRRVARIRVGSNRKQTRVKVPGPGYGKLQRYSQVLIRGAHPRDLPGIRYSIIRGKLGSDPVIVRRKARSKYGLRKEHIEQAKKQQL